jgi:hypothetical protein
VLGTPDIELKRGGHMFVSHHPLDHVRWHFIIDEPRGIGAAQIMKTQHLSRMASDMYDRLRISREGASFGVTSVGGPGGAVPITASGAS